MVRHFRLRATGVATAAVAMSVLAAACSSSPSSGGSTGSSTSPSSSAGSAGGAQALNPGTGTPKKGGTLNEVGVSDVQFMDYDVAYYATHSQMLRLTVRR